MVHVFGIANNITISAHVVMPTRIPAFAAIQFGATLEQTASAS